MVEADQRAGGGAGGAVSELGCHRVGEDADVAAEEAGVEVEDGVLEVLEDLRGLLYIIAIIIYNRRRRLLLYIIDGVLEVGLVLVGAGLA